jgi:hypothetical protein
VAHLDATTEFQPAPAVGRQVAGNDIAEIADRVGSATSREKLTPVRWKPASLAPQTKSLITATLRSAKTGRSTTPTGPM